MAKNLFFTLVNDIFYLPNRHIKFFRQRFVTYCIYQTSFEYFSISFTQYPFIYGILYLCSAVINHFLVFLGCFLPLFLVLFTVVVLTIVIFAIIDFSVSNQIVCVAFLSIYRCSCS